MTITCPIKVCSFGKQVVEKVETEYPLYDIDQFVRSPMCEYMINFIYKLKHSPEKMNSVIQYIMIQVYMFLARYLLQM